MSALSTWLAERGVYHDLVAWAEPFGDDWARAWRECPRGDWLLAIAATRETIDRRALVRAACGCAEVALEALEVASAREALDDARRWAEGAIDDDALAGSRAALSARFDAEQDPPAGAVLAAALAAMSAATEPREAPGAAAAAVQANLLATGECALETIVRYAHATTADRVRAALAAP